MALSKAIIVFAEYDNLLRTRPILTKSVTSAITAGLGNAMFQVLMGQRPLNNRSIAAFATYGFVFTGPLTHYFLAFLDWLVPPRAPYAAVRRILLDRLVFGPIFLLFTLYVLSRLEGKQHREAKKQLYRSYWSTLKMNWQVWTVFQYINLTYIPRHYRVLFANIISLGWNVYLAAMKKKAAAKKAKKTE